MIRYFLDQKSKLTSMCLQGVTVYKKIEDNQMFEDNNKYLDYYCKKGLIYYQEINKSGNVVIDSYSLENKDYNISKEKLTINSIEENKPVKRSRKTNKNKEEI